jgi:Uma2 family endonuclease
MASIAIDPAYRRVTVREFLDLDLGDAKAELVDGIILMIAGGSARLAGIAANFMIALGNRLRGSGCRPYGSDLAMRTGGSSIRFPDVSVYRREESQLDETGKLLGDPQLVFEVFSPSTASNDQIAKLAEYRARPGVQGIVFVDPDKERVRLVRPGETRDGDWLPHGSDLDLPMLGMVVPHVEIFSDL